MKKLSVTLLTCIALSLFLVSQAFSHTPLCSCYDNEDGTITCEGGFSDGCSATGIPITVVDENDEVISVQNEEGEEILLKGKMDEDSEFTFIKPKVPYKVVFDAGPGHIVEIEGENITE